MPHVLELQDELQRMPEYELYKSLRGLNTSIYIFDKNYTELRNLIAFLMSDPRATHLFWQRNRDQLDLVLIDIIRLLHNYVASSLSLIDHTRRLHRKLYTASANFSDYATRVRSDFAEDPLSQFIKCLRQYCQHYKAPNINVTVHWEGSTQIETRDLNLLVSDLKWTHPVGQWGKCL